MDTTTERELTSEIIGQEDGQHLGLAWPLALVTAVALALPTVLGPVHASGAGITIRMISGAASVAGPQSASAHTWLFALPRRARANVQIDLADVRPAARPLIQRLAGLISFDDRTTLCPPPATSCSYPKSGLDGRWGIHLDADTTASTLPSNRFLVYHEIGHAVSDLLLGPPGERAFAEAVRRALHGKPCTNELDQACAVPAEMFADEFARYAGGFSHSMSYYWTRPLLDAAGFGGLVGVSPMANPQPSPAYVERPALVRGKIVLIKIRADAPNVREDRGITSGGRFR